MLDSKLVFKIYDALITEVPELTDKWNKSSFFYFLDDAINTNEGFSKSKLTEMIKKELHDQRHSGTGS